GGDLSLVRSDTLAPFEPLHHLSGYEPASLRIFQQGVGIGELRRAHVHPHPAGILDAAAVPRLHQYPEALESPGSPQDRGGHLVVNDVRAEPFEEPDAQYISTRRCLLAASLRAGSARW